MDWIAVNCVLLSLCTESMLYALITLISMEFDFLKTDLMNLHYFPIHERSRKVNNLIELHNKLLDISDNLQKIYQSSFLMSFVISSALMCFIAFQLSTAGNDISKYAMYVPYFMAMSCQILLLCVFGQKLINASESITEGIYNCHWEEFSDNALKKHPNDSKGPKTKDTNSHEFCGYFV